MDTGVEWFVSQPAEGSGSQSQILAMKRRQKFGKYFRGAGGAPIYKNHDFGP